MMTAGVIPIDAGEKSSYWVRLPRWAKLVTVALAVIALAFGISMMRNSQAIAGSAHKRNFHMLDIAARGLETWPRDVATMAENNYPLAEEIKSAPKSVEERLPGPGLLKKRDFNHPDLGKFTIYYRPGCSDTLPKVSLDSGSLAGQGMYFTVHRSFFDEAANQSVCLLVGVPLAQMVAMRFEQGDDRSILIVDGDGRIIEQLGENRLPIASIGKLNADAGLASDLVASATQQAATKRTPVGLAEVRNVAPISIAGVDYLAYTKPVNIPDIGSTCAIGGEPGKSLASQQCFAVALLPAASLRRSWLSPPPVVTVGFGLALAGLLALLPLIRLLLIGGAESLSGFEVLGIVLGLPAAITIATFAMLFAFEVKSERTVAERETAAVASRIAGQAGEELHTALRAAFGESPASPAKSGANGSGGAGGAGGNPLKGGLATPAPPLQLSTDCPIKQNTVNDCSAAYDKHGFPLESLLFTGDDGKLNKGVPSFAFRRAFPPGFDVSARDYFIQLRRGEGTQYTGRAANGEEVVCPNGDHRYTLGQVRSQTDGYDKTLLAADCGDKGTALFTLNLRSLLAPVLPRPLHHMVVDASKPGLPVIFHEERGHAGVENFAEQATLSPVLLDHLSRVGEQTGFVADLDGEQTIFAAQPIPHSPWLVVVWQVVDDADGIASRTASRTLVAWGAIAFLFLAAGILGMVARPHGWRQFWPFERGRSDYRHLSWVLGSAALALVCKTYWNWIGALLALSLLLFTWILLDVSPACEELRGKAGHNKSRSDWWEAAKRSIPKTETWHRLSKFALLAVFVIFVALLLFDDETFRATVMLWIFAPAYTAWRLEMPHDSDDALSPPTERAYRDALLAFLACVALAPATSLWEEARTVSHTIADDSRLNALVSSLERRTVAYAALMRAIQYDGPSHLPTTTYGLPKFARYETTQMPPTPDEFGKTLWRWQHGLPIQSNPTCQVDGQTSTRVWFCKYGNQPFSIVPRAFELRPTIVVVVVAIVSIGLLAAFAWLATKLVLVALAGFRIPLGAVKGRNIELEKGTIQGGWRREVNSRGLSRRTLLVAPQQAVRERLQSYPEAWTIDLADRFLDQEGPELSDKNVKRGFDPARRDGALRPALLVASGLELILRDRPRRQAALKFLETAERKLADGSLVGIVVIAEMSPLERILDAFEASPKADDAARATREELRWARLFQTFESIIFAPIDKVGERSNFSDIADKPTWRLVAELRWLPSAVIDGITGIDLLSAIGAEISSFPIPKDRYQKRYRDAIASWAQSVKPCSEEAAIDHLRSTLIEHYEQCWVASTWAERLVLEAVARGHFVNIHHALAMQSLVRRGLVVLDPSPRLMNRSFALFVRQAERPDRLDEWRSRQPRSNWMAARLPLLLAVPLGIIGLAFSAAESGQDLTALISVLAAGAPALLAVLFKSVRSA